jgi:hypothetical protein
VDLKMKISTSLIFIDRGRPWNGGQPSWRNNYFE